MTLTKNDLSPLEALELTIIGEARGEPIEGQIAVGWIIKNRLMHNPVKYHDYRDVCFQPEQFSCWNDDSVEKGFMDELTQKIIMDAEITDRYLVQCMWVALGIDENKIIDNTNGSLYYLTTDLFKSNNRPSWSKNARNVLVKGSQTFFNV